jgi:hypothetical protein
MTAALERLNSDWLAAWSAKDVEKLVAFYTSDTVYKDPNTAQGLNGHDELRAYLTGMFAATPKMIYTPDEIWPTEAGFCGRWYCKVGDTGQDGSLRGFDLVILRDGLISHNEVYLHELDAAK